MPSGPRALLCALAVTLLAPAAVSAHQSGCHSARTCPSDHHTYVWADTSGASWDCAEPGAPEVDPARDTTTILDAGRSYLCRAAGAAPVPVPVPVPPLPPVPTPARCAVRGPLPDRSCTPGAVFTHAMRGQICRGGYTARVRHVTSATKRAVYARYGVVTHSRSTYEVDHLIPLELGGSNAMANLFPEAAAPRPGFHEKDQLENALHARVCSGRMSLRAAQKAIATDWVATWHRLGLG